MRPELCALLRIPGTRLTIDAAEANGVYRVRLDCDNVAENYLMTENDLIQVGDGLIWFGVRSCVDRMTTTLRDLKREVPTRPQLKELPNNAPDKPGTAEAGQDR